MRPYPTSWSRRSGGLSLAAALLLLSGAPAAHAFDPLGSSWANGDILMHLQLGQPPNPLSDGAPNWDAVAESAMAEWNAQMTRSRFTWVPNSTAEVRRGNRVNNIVFRPDVFGTAFGDRVLAVTLGTTSSTTGRSLEKDIVFNSNLTWNSYRGPLRSGVREFRRVVLHELGHVIGLDHPDQAQPAQAVDAVMNSIVGNTEFLTADDIAGAHALYDASSGVTPSIAAHPQSRTVQVGESYTMAVTANGSGPFTYHWTFIPEGSSAVEQFPLASGASYTIGSVQPVDAGTYTVVVSNAGGFSVTSNSARLGVTPIGTHGDTLLANISTRGVVGTETGVLIAGLVIGGSTPKSVFVRAAGPALTDFGVTGSLANPTLRIVNSAGQTVAENDDWQSSDSAAIAAANTRLGAFQFKNGSRDAAVLTTLPSGSYTAIVSGVNNTTGVALVEAYDADPDAPTARSRKLVNIATRGQVNSGENVLIAGLVVTGPGPRTYLIRAIGPTLGRSFNVSGSLSDPFLQIYQGETLLRENDDWDFPSSAQPALRAAATRVGAFALMETRDRSGLDAAMLITLQPGTYTAKVSGFEGTSGIALIEIYEMP